MNSNFEQQNQILILGENAWPGLTVNCVSLQDVFFWPSDYTRQVVKFLDFRKFIKKGA